MSAPDTELKKQKWRHRGPLIGIVLAVAVAGGLLLWMLTRTLIVETPATDDGAPAQIEGTTGIPAEGTTNVPAGTDEQPQVIEIEPEPAPGTLPDQGD